MTAWPLCRTYQPTLVTSAIHCTNYTHKLQSLCKNNRKESNISYFSLSTTIKNWSVSSKWELYLKSWMASTSPTHWLVPTSNQWQYSITLKHGYQSVKHLGKWHEVCRRCLDICAVSGSKESDHGSYMSMQEGRMFL